MPKDASATPKGTLTLKNIGTDVSIKNVAASGAVTLKYKKCNVSASLALSDQTVRSVKTLKDVVATADYKVSQVKGLTVNTKYEFAPKKWTAGLTYDTKVANKAVTVKATYNNKDKKVAGDATLSLCKNQKANVSFNQEKFISAKYTLTKDDYTFEPSYNFDKKAPAVSISKKCCKDTLKLAYDLKSENATLEWNRKPVKVSVSSTVSKSGVSKPTVSVVAENVYEF